MPPVAHHVPSNKHKLFTSALKDFIQSIRNRTTNILLKELIQILEKKNADLDQNKYNYDWSDSKRKTTKETKGI